MAPPGVELFDYAKFGASPPSDTDMAGDVVTAADMPRYRHIHGRRMSSVVKNTVLCH